MFARMLCWVIGLGVAAICQGQTPVGLATVVEGDAVLVRQTTRLALKPGMRLLSGDLLQTGATSAIVRIEFGSGAIADLGPQTQVMLEPRLASSAKRRQAPLYALSGWIKLSGTPAKDPAASVLLSEPLDLAQLSGAAVVSIQAKAGQVFAESGSVSVTERRQGQAASVVALKPDGWYGRAGTEKASVAARPPSAFMQAVPKAFLDPIPARAGLFQGKAEPAAKPLGELGYAEALPWLSAEPAVRNGLVTLWKAQLNADLRAGLTSHIKSHPEWDRVLFPEKYLPASAAPAPTGRP